MEEGGDEKGTDGQHRWIIDPLDGTTNFLHGIPLFAIAIALERAGDIVASVILSPILDELFTAERGSAPSSTTAACASPAAAISSEAVDRAPASRSPAPPTTPVPCASSARSRRPRAGIRRSGSASTDWPGSPPAV